MDLAELEKSPTERRDRRSRLMRALGKTSHRSDVNFCPYGCDDLDLDEHGYCYHLIGFTLPGDRTKYEPLLPPVKDWDDPQDHDGLSKEMGFLCRTHEAGVRKTGCGKRGKVQKGDVLVDITCSCRVYRDIDRPEWAVRRDKPTENLTDSAPVEEVEEPKRKKKTQTEGD